VGGRSEAPLSGNRFAEFQRESRDVQCRTTDPARAARDNERTNARTQGDEQPGGDLDVTDQIQGLLRGAGEDAVILAARRI